VLRRITLPLVLPGLASGVVLSFARSLGEFGATITFAGSLQGRTRTLPLEIYLQRETDPDAASEPTRRTSRFRLAPFAFTTAKGYDTALDYCNHYIAQACSQVTSWAVAT